MDQLTITKKDGANYTLLELDGALNAYTLSEFQEKVYSFIVINNVVVDMSRLVELDASGMGVIMAAHNDGEEVGHKLYLMSPSVESERVIAATGFKDMMYVINALTEAV